MIITALFGEKTRFVDGKGRLVKNDLLRGVSLSNMTSIPWSRRGLENDTHTHSSIHLCRFKFQLSSDHENVCVKSGVLKVEIPSSPYLTFIVCEDSVKLLTFSFWRRLANLGRQRFSKSLSKCSGAVPALSCHVGISWMENRDMLGL